jgi:hypothetical protein
MTDFNMNIVTAGSAEIQHILHASWLDELKANLAGKGLHLGMALPPGWRKAAWEFIEMPRL